MMYLRLIWALLYSFSIASAFSSSLQDQLQELTDCYAKHDGGNPRSLLQRRHAVNFQGDTLFQNFARLVCQANAVPRKELFETWATAIFIQERFPFQRRIADLACGHALLSWALLVLDEEEQHPHHPRSCVCIDKRIPASADTVATVLLEEYPQLESRWDFVESKLDVIATTTESSETLLCGIHACGLLSDRIISLAVEANAPLVLVPCCHTKKSLEESERLVYKNDGMDTSLAEFVDNRRVERLSKAGFEVQRKTIPEVFTPQNAVLMASPPLNRSHEPRAPINHPPLFSLPLDDSPESRTAIQNMAGRKAAKQRNRPPPPSFCVSLAMLKQDSASTTSMASLAKQLFERSVQVEHADTEAFWHSASSKYFRTFRMTYHDSEGLSLEKGIAKKMHTALCKEIPAAFPGCKVRS